MTSSRTVELRLIGDSRLLEQAFDRTANKADEAGGKAAASFSGRMKDVGKRLSKTLTPAAGAFALFARNAFSEFDAGFDAIRAGTGATGERLKALGGSMKTVGGQVTQPLSEVGQVIADLNTRTGATGRDLEDLAKKILDLARITGGDAASNVASLTRLFGDWGVTTEDQAGTLDKLFRASQQTGIPIEQLADKAVRFGAPLRQMGFSIDQTAALLGKFEKEGVNTDLVMGSLRIGLGKMARATSQLPGFQAKAADAQARYNDAVKQFGPDSDEAIAAHNKLQLAQEKVAFAQKSADVPGHFAEIVESISKMESPAEANAKALEVFGARAGPDMAAAIREGRFQLGALFQEVQSGEDTIAAASADTLDWGDRMQMLKNRVQGVIGPVGEAGMAIGGMAAGIGPTILAVQRLGWTMKGALIGTGVGAAIVAVGLIIANFDKIKRFFANVIGPAFARFGQFVAGVFRGIVDAVKGVLNTLLGLLEKHINLMLAPLRALSKAPVIGRAIPDIPEISIPRLGRGGAIREAGFADVGERGVERVFLPRGAQVVPLAAQRTSPRSGDIVIQLDGREIARVVGAHMGAAAVARARTS